ncbi:MAG: hypothetical protein U5L96_09695 [Owenweeksia sp.]|nr:hypothetical protein [Owenweeksia sp.]
MRYPIGEAVQVCLDTILEEMPYLDKLQKIRLVLFSNQDLEVHQEYLKTKEQQ